MIDVKVYNKDGKEVESLQVDEAVFGGTVRYPLLKQAIVMYHANKRVGTAMTKNRARVSGTTKKMYRQKGTGNARAGMITSPVRVGGGHTFNKMPRDFSKDMPKKMRRMACNSAILAKLENDGVVIIDQLSFEAPKTKDFASILGNLKIDRSCLVTLNQNDANIYKSARNLPKVDVMVVNDLNAGIICNKQKMLFTKDAFMTLISKNENN